MAEPAPLALRIRLAVGVASVVVGLVAAEGLTRLADGGALPHLALFVERPDGSVTLSPGSTQKLAGVAGPYGVETDAEGCRRGGAGVGWLVVGDSQVLGMGVPGDATFSAVGGHRNCGVPGHGVVDAAARARALVAPDTAGVLVVVNQANDWDEGLKPATDRYDVVGGRLIRTASSGALGRAFWSSPAPRSHLLYYVAMLAMAVSRADDPAPGWLTDPGGQQPTTVALAGVADALATQLAPTPVVVAFLPVDVAADEARVSSSPFGRYTGAQARPWADTRLRDQLQDALTVAHFVDLLPALTGRPDAFLVGDYHLSAAGHGRVAAALEPTLARP